MAVVAFFLPLLFYWKTLCPTIYVGDCGDLITAAATLGVAHPTGYPLYTMLGHLFIKLIPFRTIAFRMNLFSALCASAACGMLFYLIKRLTNDRTIALGTSLTFAFSSTFWNQATIAVTYPLSTLLCILNLSFLLRWYQTGKTKDIYLSLFILGLGLANHTIMMINVLATLLVIAHKDWDLFSKPRFHLRAILLIVPGLACYAYIPLRAHTNPAWNWANPSSLGRFIVYMSRENYWSRRYVENLHDALRATVHYLKITSSEFTLIGAALILIGLIYTIRKKKVFFFLGITLFSLNILFMLLHGSRGDIFYWPRYMLTGFIGCLLFLAFGLSLIKLKWKYAGTIVAILLPLYLCLANFHSSDKSNNYIAHDYNMNILNHLPENATLFAQGDNVLFPLGYFHYVENKRPDITLINQGVNVYPDIPIKPDKETIYFTHYHDFPVSKLALIPDGLTYRIILADAQQPTTTNPLTLPIRGIDDPSIYKDYLCRNLIGDYYLSVAIYLEKNDLPRAITFLEKAGAIDYNNATLHYNRGLFYRRNSLYAEARDAFWESVAIDHKNKNARRYIAELTGKSTLQPHE